MTDPDLLYKKLARIETCVRDLRVMGRPAEIGRDVREEYFVEHSLLVAIQAAIDVASHIVSEERLGEPTTYGELFDRLRHGGWISEDLASTMRAMAGFRNVLVHQYDEIDMERVREIAERRLGDLLGFVTAIRDRLDPRRG